MNTRCFTEHLTCSAHSTNDRRRGERSDAIQQLCWKRQQPADYWQPSVLDPCSTSSQTSCSYSRRKPKSPQRILLQTESGCSAGTKSCQVASIPPHLYEQSRRTLREGKEGLHCVRVPGNKWIMKELHCTFSQTQIWLIMCCIDGFITEIETIRHYSMMVHLQCVFLLVLLHVYTLYLLYKGWQTDDQ